MPVIAIGSAKGSPGVTTTALGLALLHEGPVLLVEADPAGGSSILAGYLRGTVAHDRSLLDVALGHELGEPVADTVARACVPLPGAVGDARLLPAVQRSQNAASLPGVWSVLAEHLRSLSSDGVSVIVDLGRFGAEHGGDPLARSADLLVLALRPTLVHVAAARSRLPLLRNDLDRNGLGQERIRNLVIGPGHTYSTREVTSALDIPDLPPVALDARAAAVLSDGAAPGRGRSALTGSLQALQQGIAGQVAALPGMSAPDRGRLA